MADAAIRRARSRRIVAAEDVAAIVFEPVQGEGGFIPATQEFVQGLREICDEHGIVLVCDEVQTGFARTGRFFAIEHFGVEPDLITVAKSIAMGMPLSGVLGKAEIMDAPVEGGVGGTFVGNPVAQAAALAVLDVIEDEGLVERSAAIGETMRARMESWQERWPQIGDVRGLGAMLAIELVARARRPRTDLASRVVEEALCARPSAPEGGRARELHPRARPARDLGRGARRGAPRLGRRARPPRFSIAGAGVRSPSMVIGDVLSDRYELEELVGTGGMSSVYRAHDRLLDRKVALKILHQQYTDDAEYVERFRHEARAVAALSHPNIVTVIDRGEHDGRQFIVFEYIEGENLKRLIERRGPAPGRPALELAMQIARGALVRAPAGPRPSRREAAERAPERRRAGEGDRLRHRALARRQARHDADGTVLGTSDYIAPEQAQGQRVDEHTDVYSLGVVLYELLTSEVPFPGENFVAVAMRHINEEPPSIRDKRPDVSPRVEAAVHRAMAKDPQARFQTMADFCRELEACLAEVQGDAGDWRRRRPARAPRGAAGRVSPWPLVLVLVALIAIGAVIAVLAHPPRRRAAPAQRRGLGRRRARRR